MPNRNLSVRLRAGLAPDTGGGGSSLVVTVLAIHMPVPIDNPIH